MTDTPSIAALRAMFFRSRSTHHHNDCWQQHKGCAILRFLDVVQPLLREHQNCVDDRLDEKGMEPTELAGEGAGG